MQPQTQGAGQRNTQASIDGLCKTIHGLVFGLPELSSPGAVPFTNGLYLFFQAGEVCVHSTGGRIVRVGNHPRSQDRLRARLQQHYSGKKNCSVFRKHLGGALLRRSDPNNPCLLPGPGKGHWERQDAKTCPSCASIEREVSALLFSDFRLRCIEVIDKSLRNRIEEGLVATLSLCRACHPSRSWLGQYAYNDAVRRSGLWNSDYVHDQSRLLSEDEIATLSSLIEDTIRQYWPARRVSP